MRLPVPVAVLLGQMRFCYDANDKHTLRMHGRPTVCGSINYFDFFDLMPHAPSRKVAGSRIDEVNSFFQFT
jgi:hypothetical protein